MEKKEYSKPLLQTEDFDVEDVITASDLDTVGGGRNGMEVLLDNLANMIGGNP